MRRRLIQTIESSEEETSGSLDRLADEGDRIEEAEVQSLLALKKGGPSKALDKGKAIVGSSRLVDSDDDETVSDIGGPDVSGPSDVASLTQEELDEIREEYEIPPNFQMRLAKQGETVSCVEEGWVALYTDLFEKGCFRLPLCQFFEVFLVTFQLSPSEVTSNSWRALASFMILCSDLGVPPSLGLLNALFEIKKLADGLVYLAARRRQKIFDLPSSTHPDRSRYFVCRPEEGWRIPTHWGNRSLIDLKCDAGPLLSQFLEGAKAAAEEYRKGFIDTTSYCSWRNLIESGVYITTGV